MHQVITLDRDDDVGSIKAKVLTAGAEQVGLVVPPGNRELKSPLTARVLAKSARDAGIELSVITRDGVVRRLAADAGVRGFATVGAYRHYVDHGPGLFAGVGQGLAALSRGQATLFAFALVIGFFALLGGAFYVIFPTATVVLSPAGEVMQSNVRVVADPSTEEPDTANGRIPLRVVVESVEANGQAPATGVAGGPNALASGQVTLTNRTSEDLVIPAESEVVATTGVKFRTLQEAILEPGATARVAIRAIEPGDGGRVGRLEISRLDGPLQNQVTVLNEEPTTFAEGARAVSHEDRARVRDETIAQAWDEAVGRLQALAGEDEVFVVDAFEFTPLEEWWDHNAGDAAESVSYRAFSRVTAVYYVRSMLEKVALDTWKPIIRSGYHVLDGETFVGDPTVSAVEGRVVTLIVPVRSLAVADISRERVEDFVRWRPATDARRDLARVFSLADEPQVTISPGWASRALRVNVFLNLEPAQSTEP